jgi:hypothetical protein
MLQTNEVFKRIRFMYIGHFLERVVLDVEFGTILVN